MKNSKSPPDQSGSNDLPQIFDFPNLKEDVKRFEALSETKELEFKNCKHTKLTSGNGELRCECGASWSGPGLNQLEALLKNRHL